MNIDISAEFLEIKEKLRSYLYRLTASKEDADDLVHDTFIRVSEKRQNFKGESSFKTWVFAIATNLAYDNKRVKKRWALDVQDRCKDAAVSNKGYQERMITAFQNQTEKQFEIAEHINYCFTCIAKNLSLEKQIAIVLKEVYDFKIVEIATILKSSEGVVKHLLFNGRQELQQKYEKRCALINKTGVCYQCAQLNDYFQDQKNSSIKVAKTKLSQNNSPEKNLEIRFNIINKINPLSGNGAILEDTILQILREAIND